MAKASKIKGGREQGQLQIEVPAKVARKMPFKIDENVEWIVVDEDMVVLLRTDEPFLAVKKNPTSPSRRF
ncbi:hypothetical protein D3C86_2002700 [compost metagenome]